MFDLDFMPKASIIEKLEATHTAIIEYVNALNKAAFETAPEGKWTAGQQIEHLYLSIKDLELALGMPKIALSAVLGKAQRPSVTYDEVVEDYTAVLSKGAKAPVEYCPAEVSYSEKETTVNRLKETATRLCQHVQHFSENDLDHYTTPHPLLNTLTLREMLFFIIFHVEYHHQSIQQGLA